MSGAIEKSQTIRFLTCVRNDKKYKIPVSTGMTLKIIS